VCVQATDGSDGWALRALPEAERKEVRLAEARAVAQAAGSASSTSGAPTIARSTPRTR
jgi:hypothetical protein